MHEKYNYDLITKNILCSYLPLINIVTIHQFINLVKYHYSGVNECIINYSIQFNYLVYLFNM